VEEQRDEDIVDSTSWQALLPLPQPVYAILAGDLSHALQPADGLTAVGASGWMLQAVGRVLVVSEAGAGPHAILPYTTPARAF
jgi:hypothetical protein